MKQPLVSIIIPTYNRAHLIGETLDSVLAQTYTNWECIVVDDGSTDKTDQLLNEYCANDNRFQYHHRPSDRLKGANACRNYGFELCSGEYVNWFDDDDLMLEDFLKVKVTTFTKKLDIIICSGYYVNEKLVIYKEINLINTDNLFKDYLLWNLHLLTPSILFRKSFLNGNNLFSPKIYRGQETELFSRLFFQLTKDSYRIVNCPLFYYRQHEDAKSFKAKSYFSKFKFSQGMIYLENLKRSILLKEKPLIKHCLNLIGDVFFSAVKNRDNMVSKYVLKELFRISMKTNKSRALKFLILGNGIIYFGSVRYSVKQIFKKSIKFIYS